MARIITTQTVVKNGFKLINNYTDNSKAVNTFYEDDIVDDFSFVMDRQKITVSGRITNVKLSNKRIPTKKYVDDKSSVENDTKIKNVGIDYSEKNYAKVTDINPREILEYKPTKEVKKVDIIPTRKVNLSVTLSDDTTSSVELKEGMKSFNVNDSLYVADGNTIPPTHPVFTNSRITSDNDAFSSTTIPSVPHTLIS